MSIENRNGALLMATGIDNSGLISGANQAEKIIKGIADDTVKASAQMESSLKGVGSALAALGGTAAIGMLGKDILETTAKFEKFSIVLKNTLGEAEGAAALDMIAEFAATTPFQLDEVTASFIKMANQGFVPTKTELVQLGDLASSTGKSFDQLTEALLDAQTGQFERLKEFGIKASAQGDKVTFSFKEQQTTVDNTNSAIQAYMLSLGNLQGVTGANAKISESLTGQISNLEDKFAAMYNTIGTANSGVLYDAVGLSSALITNYEEVGKVIISLGAIYGTYTATLLVFSAVKKAELTLSVLMNAANIENTLSTVTLTTAQELQSMSTIKLTALQKLQILTQSALNKVVLGNPYALAAAAIVTLAAGMYYLSTRTTDAEKAHNKLTKTINETNGSIASENVQIDTLFARLKSAKKGSEEYQAAKDDIQKKYGSYLSGLDAETKSLNNVALAYNAIKKAASDAAKARALDKATQEAADDFAKRTENNLRDLQELLNEKYGKNSKKSIELFYQLKPAVEGNGAFKVKEDFLKSFDFKKVVGGGGYGAEIVTNQLQNIIDKSKQAKSSYQSVIDEAYKYLGGTSTKSGPKEGDKKTDAGVDYEFKSGKWVEIRPSETPAQRKARLAAEKKAAAQEYKVDQSEYNAKKDLQTLLVDLQNQTASLLIKISEDNLQSRLDQIDLEKKQEIEKIREKEVAVIDAYNKAHNGDNAFKPLSTESASVKASINNIDPGLGKQLADEELNLINAYGQKKTDATKLWGEEMNDLVMQYAEERVKIAYDYDKQIRELLDKEQYDAAIAREADKKQKISEVSKGLLEETNLYKLATGDQLMISKALTEKLIAEMRKRIEADKTLTATDKAKMLGELNKADLTVQKTDNPFTDLMDGLAKYKKAREEQSKVNAATDIENFTKLEDAANKAQKATLEAAAGGLQGIASIISSVTSSLDDLGALSEEDKKTADQVIGMLSGAANLAMGIATGNPIAIIQGSVELLANAYKLFDTESKKIEERIKADKDAVDALTRAYNQLENAIKKAYSSDKANLISKEIENLEKQKQLKLDQIEAEKQKNVNYKKNINFFNAPWQYLFAPKTDNKVVSGLEDDLDKINQQIEDNKDAAIESLTGTSITSAIDEFANVYADAFTSGEDAALKSAEAIKNILKTALIEKLKKELQPGIETLMDMVSNAMLDGVISEQEKAEIYAQNQKNTDDANKYGKAFEDLGLSDTKNGVTGELKAAMTEGTASQLVGLWNMTAMDIRQIKEWLMLGSTTPVQGQSADVSSSINSVLSEARLIQVNTRQTADNTLKITKSLDEVKSELSEIKKNTKYSQSRL